MAGNRLDHKNISIKLFNSSTNFVRCELNKIELNAVWHRTLDCRHNTIVSRADRTEIVIKQVCVVGITYYDVTAAVIQGAQATLTG